MARPSRHRSQTLRELQQRFERMGPYGVDRELMILDALMFIAAQTAPAPKPKRARKPSAYHAFFAAGMKADKTPKQIGEEWQRRKAVRSA